MANHTKKLTSKFLSRHRYTNFGPCLRSIFVDGFRGIMEINLNIDFPITAISGLNGAGKSTLGQLAVCAYKRPTTASEYRRQYIKDFFPISRADPKPISDNAKIIYLYETEEYKSPQEVTVSRASSAWSGYKRQPERYCYYIGFTVYIPKVERRDLSVYGGKDLTFTEKRHIDEPVIVKMAKIIGYNYNEVSFQGVAHKGKKSEIGIASRLGCSYSENNMGFGEGRILYTVDKLETSPVQSLFVIEEPETALHENAQYEFAKYLLDVCSRRHHQVIVTTHSSAIMQALPPSSRKLLMRNENGVNIIDNISIYQVQSLLSGGHRGQLIVCVEDEFAKILLVEAIRIRHKELLDTIDVHPVGDQNAVKHFVCTQNKIGKKAIGVRDADIEADIKNQLFSLPGKSAPELEVFSCMAVISFFKQKYDIDIGFAVKQSYDQDHHDIAGQLAEKAKISEDHARRIAIEQYVSKNADEFEPLIKQIRNALND